MRVIWLVMKIRKNHDIPLLLKARVSTHAILKTLNIRHSGGKRLCIKLKLSGDCSRVPDSGRKLLIEVTVIIRSKVPNQASQPNNS